MNMKDGEKENRQRITAVVKNIEQMYLNNLAKGSK